MREWSEFKTVGDARPKPARGRVGAWVSMICLVLFLSTVGLLVVVLLVRLIPLLILASVFGWGYTRRSAEGLSRLQLGRGDWGMLFCLMFALWGIALARAVLVGWWGEAPGNLATFGLINVAVAVAVWFCLRGVERRERADEARRAERAKRLARAQEAMAHWGPPGRP
ncbi:MAG TPA: hypothetical protein PLG73_16425 [Candidatus Sumerlaeota bacterium]|nr:hypothetical protein [Candidatus Sumerlaeota bacterium]